MSTWPNILAETRDEFSRLVAQKDAEIERLRVRMVLPRVGVCCRRQSARDLYHHARRSEGGRVMITLDS